MPMMLHIRRLKTMKVGGRNFVEFNYWKCIRDVLMR